MQLSIYKDYEALSIHAAEFILSRVKGNPRAVLCFATGDTPRLTYQLMTEKAARENIDFTGCTFIGLDEWVGTLPGRKGSCRFDLQSMIFDPLNVGASQIYLFDGMAADLASECIKMDKAIEAKGGIDLLLAGVGTNGHIGFNEPGVSPHLLAHVIDLEESTLSGGRKYFTGDVNLKQGITLGLKHVLQSRELIMMASGLKKAPIIKRALEDAVDSSVPATFIRTHPEARVMIDEEAGSLLSAR